MEQTKIDKIVADYDSNKDLYNKFAEKISCILKNLLKKHNFFFLTITPRIKSIKSLRNKLNRKNDESRKTFVEEHDIKKYSDVQDLVGARVLFYLESDARKFVDFVCDELGKENIMNIDWKIKKRGYRAIHIIVKLTDASKPKLSKYSQFEGLKCEIQLTTVLYHAWSEMSRKLIYNPVQELVNFDKKAFDVLNKHFEDVMENHIAVASVEFESIYYRFQEIKKGKEIFDVNFLKNISKETSNNKIYRQLVLLREYTAKFGYKFRGGIEAVELMTEVIEKSRINKLQNENTVFGEIPGKTYEDIVSVCLEILDLIRYSNVTGIFNVLTRLYRDENGSIKEKIQSVLKNLSEYNFYALQQNRIGLSIQTDILHTISTWNSQKRIANIDLIIIVATEFLQLLCKGVRMADWQTITSPFGAFLHPTSCLKKIRYDTIDLIKNLYNSDANVREKISLLKILKNVINYPSQGDYSKIQQQFDEMITDDVKYLVKFYRSIISDKIKISMKLPIMEEIENQLSRVSDIQKQKIKGIKQLLEKLQQNELYCLYRLLIGDVHIVKAPSYKERQEKINREINRELKKINSRSLPKWMNKLNIIAETRSILERWRFQRFEDFLSRIAREKTTIAKKLLKDVFNENKPLKSEIWDEYKKRIKKKKNIDLLNDLVLSIWFISKPEFLKYVRKEDIHFLAKVVHRQNPWKFLNEITDKNKLFDFNLKTFQVLLQIYKKNEKRIEALIITLIKTNPEDISCYLRELFFAVYQRTVGLSRWSKKSIKLLFDKMVEIDDLNDDAQNLLVAISKKDNQSPIQVFIRRIRKHVNMKTTDLFSLQRYQAVPFYLNAELIECIKNHPGFYTEIEKWFKKMSTKYSTYNTEYTKFLQHVDYNALKDVLLALSKTKKYINVTKVFRVLENIEYPDYDICFEIIKTTDDPRIWNNVMTVMYKIGTVSGEYGIVNAYKSIINRIKDYPVRGNDVEKKRIGEFKRKIVANLKRDIVREKERVDKEIRIRKMEFEG
jgi:ppGpp synthetase/RelA/SpoT-type nucleotidyltranferase